MADPETDVQRIDRLCDLFEAAWQRGERPDIETYLSAADRVQHPTLLRELLLLELEYRARHGERPAPAEYQERFAAHKEVVAAAFAQPTAAPSRAGTLGPDPEKAPFLTLTVIEGPHQGRVFSFTGHEIFLVGRSKEAHLQLPNDGYFSRVHFMVEINPPRCRVIDLGSRNKTYVNGQPVHTTELRPGDLIKAGHTTLRASFDASSAGAAALPSAGAATEAMTLVAAPVPSMPATLPETLVPPSPAAPIAQTLPSSGTEPLVVATRAPLPPVPGYRVLRELGRGGMGVVYLAACEADGAQVALKTILPAVAVGRNQIERFLRETRILCQLEHAYIIRLRETGEANGLLYFAMDYVDGQDAARLLKQQGPLPVRMAVRILYQLLSALGYAHAKGFVHRDVKPANILVAEQGGKKVVKLADFGLARVYQESRMSGLTMQGDVGGTVAFIPPEQITHFRRVQPAADQYSAAATLYNLLTGRFLYDFDPGGPPPLTRVLQEEPVPIIQRRPEVPEALASVIHRALSKDPNARFPDANALRAALAPFAR